MVADPAARPEVLPTDRLLANGMARPEICATTCGASTTCATPSPWSRCGSGWWSIIGGAVWIDNPWAYLAAFVLMGPMYARFAILMHEAAHKLLFTNKRANDWVGHLAHRLSRLDAHLHLPAGPLRPPQGGVRARRAGHGLLRRLPVRPPHPGAGGWSATRSASPAGRTSPRCSRRSRSRPFRPVVGSRSSASRWCCGPSCGRPPAGGGSTRCCGGCRG